MDNSIVELTMTGKVCYSDIVSPIQAARIIEFLNPEADSEGKGDFPDMSKENSSNEVKAKKVESPREAIDISGAQKNAEKIVALAAYVLQDGGETFKVEDVKAQFRRAREAAPKNFSRDMGTAISSGWIADDQSGEYYLTSKVEGIFEEGFSFPKSVSGSRSRSIKKSGVKMDKPETLEDIDEFFSECGGYPSYSKMKTEKDKLLWVLAYMKEKHGRSSLSNKEIEYISNCIGVGVPNANITATFNNAKKQGYAVRSTKDRSIRITDTGIDYVRTFEAKA